MTDVDEKKLGRRELLSRGVKAGTSIAAAGALAYFMYDREGPGAGLQADKLVTLPVFSVPRRQGQDLSIVGGQDRAKTVCLAGLSGSSRRAMLSLSSPISPSRPRRYLEPPLIPM